MVIDTLVICSGWINFVNDNLRLKLRTTIIHHHRASRVSVLRTPDVLKRHMLVKLTRQRHFIVAFLDSEHCEIRLRASGKRPVYSRDF